MSFPVFKSSLCPEVHASTLLVQNSTLLCAWFGGTKEGHPDTKIWLSNTKLPLNPKSVWSQPRIIANEEKIAHWNPVLFKEPSSKRIFLFYKVGSPISSWRTKIKESADGGQTWSEPHELVPGDVGGRGPVKNKPIILPNRTIVAPASLETADGVWTCFSDTSRDGGMTWSRSTCPHIDRDDIPGEGAIQPSLIFNNMNNTLSMFTRSSSGFVLRADSTDDGKSWGTMYRTALYNNNSGLDALGFRDDLWLVVHNPVNQRWGPRTPLVISCSNDQGNTWRLMTTLEDKQPPAGFTKIVAKDTGIVNDGASEFSYPAIIEDQNGGIIVSYTYERVGIKVVQISADNLSMLQSQ